jgi:hypothetical protein
MAQLPPASVLALLLGAAFALGGCGSMTTYGTGTTAARQTVDDLTGILALGGSKKGEDPIDYEPRPPIVEPPTATLPPPGSGTSATAVAGNWPVDPDEERERIDALVKERQEAGQSLKFTVPEGANKGNVNQTDPLSDKHDDDIDGPAQRVTRAKMNGSYNLDEAQKLMANAKNAKIGSFDEDGNPVRRYLTEPPPPYREPDPESPVEVTEKPKKKNGLKLPDLWPF